MTGVQAIKGMAHFSGTGPPGTHCHQCKHFSGKRPEWEGQPPKRGTCKLVARFGKSRPAKFSGGELSCNRYEAAE